MTSRTRGADGGSPTRTSAKQQQQQDQEVVTVTMAPVPATRPTPRNPFEDEEDEAREAAATAVIAAAAKASGAVIKRRRPPVRSPSLERRVRYVAAHPPPQLRSQHALTFPSVDWLALANHLFLLASGGYFFMNFWRVVLSDKINSSLGASINSALFFSLALVYIASAAAYWVDIVSFPEGWTRRHHYHPLLRRTKVPVRKTDDGTEFTEEDLAAEEARAVASGYVPPGSAENGLPKSSSSDSMGSGSSSAGSSRTGSRKASSNPFASDDLDYDDLGTVGYLNARATGLLSYLSCNFCQRVWTWRPETWSEILNMLGAGLNFFACLLPYVLGTFRADKAISFDSVPLSIALMDLGSMTAWLASALLIYWIWRRDAVSVMRERWEAKMEEESGIPIKMRRALEIREDARIAEANKITSTETLTGADGGPASPMKPTLERFVPRSFFAVAQALQFQWWACFLNVLASIIYFGACVWGLGVSVVVEKGLTLTRNARNPHTHSSHNSDGSMDVVLSPQQVQEWIEEQRIMNLAGDILYVACAVFCEMVYYRETHKELGKHGKVTDLSAIEAEKAGSTATGAATPSKSSSKQRQATLGPPRSQHEMIVRPERPPSPSRTTRSTAAGTGRSSPDRERSTLRDSLLDNADPTDVAVTIVAPGRTPPSCSSTALPSPDGEDEYDFAIHPPRATSKSQPPGAIAAQAESPRAPESDATIPPEEADVLSPLRAESAAAAAKGKGKARRGRNRS